MRSNLLITSIFAAATLFTVAGCSSNQAVKTTDGNTVVTDGKPEVDKDTGLVSYKNAQTGQTEQINRDQVKSMSELDN
ncbi:YgdI/YgdR family lipoprotein [Cronobacter dublinensis]|uniref:YgdI/YgdR family lipoprotein n=1 Tax=Cronobacter dublinensis TaxID=413497 RepID=A0A9Q4XKQ4_9ENTR|nr:YgdI/YgdR family lipoprotein [Cronobacter dublinensis]EGT5659954.1 YgdI/YgdR family lipoprotein [Cronobacter dublinensis subsp. dublinensis]EGT4359951.1 YgdI/YgdR family lipoprotein [Cronobacter dublinensis]EGT5669253.1 YgdI/YgdR family lipoprotein [Cronobacter dublinensis subsp. dublinensis]EGT5674281.1 YgdI/YgdR family lipoprotein [Cronobacter dublinensis subsp. dublinensis]EGT5677427.1 YgdI/YgdR family lipoprotein [Cronobacter dublinensis subsp. dublinensis]